MGSSLVPYQSKTTDVYLSFTYTMEVCVLLYRNRIIGEFAVFTEVVITF